MKKIFTIVLVALIAVSAAFATEWTVSAGVGVGSATTGFGFTLGADVEYLYKDNVSFYGSFDDVLNGGIKLRAGAEYTLYQKDALTVESGVGLLYSSNGFGGSLRLCGKYLIKDQYSAFVSVTPDFSFSGGVKMSFVAKAGVSYAF